jgi:hypothetical protein
VAARPFVVIAKERGRTQMFGAAEWPTSSIGRARKPAHCCESEMFVQAKTSKIQIESMRLSGLCTEYERRFVDYPHVSHKPQAAY